MFTTNMLLLGSLSAAGGTGHDLPLGVQVAGTLTFLAFSYSVCGFVSVGDRNCLQSSLDLPTEGWPG